MSKGWHDLEDSLRKSGRTTAMLREAVMHAHKGKSVVVVASSIHQANEMVRSAVIGGMDEAMNLGLRFVPADSPDIDWTTLRMRGVAPETVVLFDHFALETKFSNVLSFIHRYDNKRPKL